MVLQQDEYFLELMYHKYENLSLTLHFLPMMLMENMTRQENKPCRVKHSR